MTTGVRSFVYPVKDLAAAKTFYSGLLGVEPHTDQPYYVGFRVGDQEIALDPNGHRAGLTGTVAYWDVDDIAAHVAQLQAGGATVQQAVHDVGAGLLIAVLQDPDGNIIGLMQSP
jgi:predicted enzyme related to lactoylglutathione lyase